MLNWAKQFNIFCFLDNCGYNIKPHQYECLLAVDAVAVIKAGQHSVSDLDTHTGEGWWFGHLSYELQHPLFGLKRTKADPVGFPQFCFFRPRIVIYLIGNELHIEGDGGERLFMEMMQAQSDPAPSCDIQLRERMSRSEYIERVALLKQHMQRGDCYEANFCLELFAEDARLNPIQVYKNLVAYSPSPFAALYRLEHRYLVCASPERFILKEGNRILAQPVKGTAGRSKVPEEDQRLKNGLRESAKERAENVMIVDLLRNDLSRICGDGSVTVDELLGVYTFPQVHQMISTISGRLSEDRFSEIIRAVFPMGSMTGAPKQSVMKLIDRYEPVARGIFSGSVGYIHPSGDFDFNVVIRSILYNHASAYVSCLFGSGITVYCDAAAEWEECMLKGAAIKKVLAGPALR